MSDHLARVHDDLFAPGERRQHGRGVAGRLRVIHAPEKAACRLVKSGEIVSRAAHLNDDARSGDERRCREAVRGLRSGVLGLEVVTPCDGARGRIERKDAVLCAEKHDAVNDDEPAFEEPALVACVKGPGALQVLDVVGIDLGERRKLGRSRVLSETRPVVLSRHQRHGRTDQDRH